MTDDGSDCATVMKDHELFSSPKASRHSVPPGCVTVGEYDLLSVENRSIFHLCPVQHMCSGVYQPIYLLGGELRDAKVISGSGATCSAYLLLRGQLDGPVRSGSRTNNPKCVGMLLFPKYSWDHL